MADTLDMQAPAAKRSRTAVVTETQVSSDEIEDALKQADEPVKIEARRNPPRLCRSRPLLTEEQKLQILNSNDSESEDESFHSGSEDSDEEETENDDDDMEEEEI